MKRFVTILLLAYSYAIYATPADKTQLISLLHQAELFILSDNYGQAAKLRDQSMALFKELGTDNDTSTINGLQKLSQIYHEKSFFSDAVILESLLVEVYPSIKSYNKTDYAAYLTAFSLYLVSDGNTELAEENIKKALMLIKDGNGLKDATIYSRAAEIFAQVKPQRIDLSIAYQGKAVDIYANTYGTTSSEYLDELWYLANYLEKAKEYDSACSAYMEILHTLTENGKETQRFLPILDRIIFCSRKNKNKGLEQSTKDYAFSIAMDERIVHDAIYNSSRFPTTEDSINYVSLSEKIYSYRELMNQYGTDSDLTLFNKIKSELNNYISTLPDSYSKAAFLTNESFNNLLINNWKETLENGIAALQIYDKLGIITKYYVLQLYYVANAYSELDNPAKAYEYILRAYELRDKYLSSDNIHYSEIVRDLGLYCSYLGNYQDAIKFGTMAVKEEFPYAYSDSPQGYFMSLNNLATYYGLVGYYYGFEDAYKYELKTLQYLVDKSEDIAPTIIESPESPILFNLAKSYYANGNYTKSLEIGLKAKENTDKGARKILIADIYKLLASIYQRLGKVEEALNYAIHANDILKESGRDDDLALANSYDILAGIYSDMQKHEKAEEMARSSINLKYQNIIHNFVNLSSDDRTSYWIQYSSWFSESYPNYFFQSKIQDATELYNKSALFAKGILLNADTEMSKLILESGDYKALTKYQKILTNRSLLSKNNSNDNTDMKMSMDSLRMETDKLERELIQECKVYGDYTKTMRTTWQDVQTALKPNDIAIEFLSFPYFGSTFNKTLYAALILRKDDTSPQFISLFDEAELDTISNDVYSDKLYELIWKPIEQYLSGVDNVYFSPSGKLYNINIEIIPEIVDKNNGKNYYRVSSTRLIAHPYHSSITHGHTIIYGGLDYNTSVSNLIADSKSYTNKEPQFRGNANDIELRSGWDYLPATLDEANSIGSTMRSYKIPTIIYTDTIGTEASFKSLDGQLNKIIHLATHGFYYSERDSTKMKKARIDYMLNQINIKSRSYIEDYSLTRSGLLLAGCNNILRGYNVPDDVEDGILFAKEIASMNLKNVDLVTLSSCDSGLGDITGEGVLGLQRAFKKAGVNTLLMSLNKVDDEATQILMVEFYKNLMSGKTKYQSLKDAQTHLRTIENGKYAAPKYWASFIMLDGLN